MKQIQGIPESITREQYLAMISAAGFDVNDLRRLEFRMDGIYADVMERSDKGHPVVDEQRNEVVVNQVYIPVKD